MKRKSPIKHKVRSHERIRYAYNPKLPYTAKVVKVREYARGRGSNTSKIANPALSSIEQKGMKVAMWAVKKYGDDALYMLKETGEGREVWGEIVTNQAIHILEKEAIKIQKTKEQIKELTGGLIVDVSNMGHGGVRASVEGLSAEDLAIAKKGSDNPDSEEAKIFDDKIFPKLRKYMAKPQYETLAEGSYWVEGNKLELDSGD